ncbi:NAD/NADP-dependent octopine/nopaline dehydrogenase family protein [Feifania hominis]|uniref:NAD/NADP octopine/nopaline dehydrogenase family protein n=1 Tax=Feifania hominis TaxID=2763660 RepID=A0A926DDS9_9FIRM|nr:NAD/NADP-dependent octopine/nopaline dehydrogenase family protein [Feifania hominis]MBC8536248.1 NAD/NADP octopine/nopaline dehydrogenase family protein [Feifania hominis]
MLNQNRVAIISSGNGGQALAAYYTYRGYEAALYAREQQRVDMFPSNVFTLSGVTEAEVPISLISCDMGAVVRGAHLIMVTTPSQYHHVVAREMAPHLEDGQIIVLNPGRTFGTFTFEQALRESGCESRVVVAEAETFIFTCRCAAVGQPVVYKIKDHMKVAAHDAARTPLVVETLRRVFPTVEGAKDVLETGFGNMGMIFHPLPILMNLTRVEAKERFLYYQNAISPLVGSMIERMDAERVAVARAMGVQTLPVLDWLFDKYGSRGATVYECLQNTDAYREVYTPTDLCTRYVFEDVPTGCVPMLAMGRRFGIEMPVTEAVIRWASAVYGRDFYAEGRNEFRLDLDALIGRRSA